MAEERNIRIEDSEGNSYYPHAKAKTTFFEDGTTVETHQADTTLHITATERAKWNNPATTAEKITVADTANLFVATDVEGALKELFTNASDGKTRIANAAGSPSLASDTFTKIAGDITTGKAKIAAAVRGKGGTANDTDSLEVMASVIGGIQLNKKEKVGTFTMSGASVAISGLGFKPKTVGIKFSNNYRWHGQMFSDDTTMICYGIGNSGILSLSDLISVKDDGFVIKFTNTNITPSGLWSYVAADI